MAPPDPQDCRTPGRGRRGHKQRPPCRNVTRCHHPFHWRERGQNADFLCEVCVSKCQQLNSNLLKPPAADWKLHLDWFKPSEVDHSADLCFAVSAHIISKTAICSPFHSFHSSSSCSFFSRNMTPCPRVFETVWKTDGLTHQVKAVLKTYLDALLSQCT